MRTAITISLALIGCVLVGTLHAQVGNIFKEVDVRQIDNFLKRVIAFREDLAQNADYSQYSPPKVEEVCRRTLAKNVSYVFDSVSSVEMLLSISSQMNSTVDEAIVNNRLNLRIIVALSTTDLCPQMAKDVIGTCVSNSYIVSKALEITQLCSEGAALLDAFLRRSN